MPSSSVASARQVRELFDRIAPDYDRLNTLLSLGLHRIWKGMAVRWSHPVPGGSALDICCGSGDLALELARQMGPGSQVYGVDFSPNLLAIARHRSRRLRWGDRLSWVEGDALQLPFSSQTFDSVTMGYGLRNVTDIPLALRELYRVLRPGGWAAILDFQPIGPSSSDHTPMGTFQAAYLDRIVVPMAAALGLQAEYTYIQDSLCSFPSGCEQQQLAIAAGFSQPHYYSVAAGLMGVLTGQKPFSDASIHSPLA